MDKGKQPDALRDLIAKRLKHPLLLHAIGRK